MKRDSVKYEQARILRGQGWSIRQIAKHLKISTSTSSIWCEDIELLPEQRSALDSRGVHAKLLREFARQRHTDKLSRHNQIHNQAKKEIKSLSNNELFLIGLALYWAEGFKNIKEHRVGFCNSDPRMIELIMCWFRYSLKIPDNDFTLRVEFNISHKDRKDEIEDHWSKITDIPLSQFNSPYLQKTNQIKNYSDRGIYYGLLRIRIRRSSELLVQLRGWIEGLSLTAKAFRRGLI